MEKLFNRPLADEHPWRVALVDLWNHEKIEYRALARNLAFDHRVSAEREQELLIRIPAPVSGDELRRKLEDYFNQQIRTRARPDFVYQQSNQDNFVAGWTSEPVTAMASTVFLAHVLDLNGLLEVFQVASSQQMSLEALRGFPGGSTALGFDRWLSSKLRGEEGPFRFVPQVLELMEAVVPHRTYHPTWVTFWTRFEPYLRQGPGRWLDALGRPTPAGPRWLIVLRYPINPNKLVRPTLLETEVDPYHFPSPPKAPLTQGGHPMDLSESAEPGHGSLLSEFIHQQLVPKAEYWEDAGRLCKRTESKPRGDLALLRRRHLDRLKLQYGPRSVREWWSDPGGIGG